MARGWSPRCHWSSGGIGGYVRTAGMPFNEYGQSGELAIDPEVDAEAVVGAMVNAIRQLGLKLLWLEGIDLARPTWQTFQKSLAASGATIADQPIWTEGIVDILGNFKTFEASRSRNLRDRSSARRSVSTPPAVAPSK